MAKDESHFFSVIDTFSKKWIMCAVNVEGELC